MRFTVRRGSELTPVDVRTIADPGQPRRSIVGVFISQNASIKLPLKVKIDAGDVGGPSAGLAFALEVMEKLGRDVDHGQRVAATGQLELDGSVSPVGGLKQKTIGVRVRESTSSSSRLGKTPPKPGATRGGCGSCLCIVFDRRCARWQRCQNLPLSSGFRRV